MTAPLRFSPPRIEPRRAGGGPFWSVMIPTYNGADRIEGALASVLAQDPGPAAMQIEVVDDGSASSDTEAVVRRLGGERVAFHRQPRNVGHSANFNTCIERARGEVVHILHDDDAVRPGFYAALEPALREQPEVGAAFVRTIYADADGSWRAFSPVERPTPGVIEDWLQRIASGQRVTTPSFVVRRSTYEAVGGFGVPTYGEDWEMWIRIATRFPVWFEPEPLAIYRMERPGSLSGDVRGTAGPARYMLEVTDVVASYLPTYLGPEGSDAALARARRMYARWAVTAAFELARARHRREASAALRTAWQATDPMTVVKAIGRNALATRFGGSVQAP
jgi:glycosyltransferase involved in cell wall biosynthesis